MKTGPELIEELRQGTFSLEEFIAAAPNLASEHFGALLGTAYMLWPDDLFNTLFHAARDHKPAGVFLPFYASPEEADLDRGVGMVFESLLSKKREKPWSDHDINRIIHLYVTGQMPFNEHIAAILGAIMVKGLTMEETAALTTAMTNSGDKLSFPSLDAKGLVAVDKHSTGGIGDGTSLVLAPLVAASCPDVYLPMMSGRGLGHTGGTLDKLEAIPGFRVRLSQSELEAILTKTRVAIFGQTDSIAPADGKIYALRDATNCVANDGLIVASILSKKLAEGTKVLVMDAKYGAGAFLEKEADCRNFAQLICDVGKASGLTMAALMTNMDEPLGSYAGNKLEVVYSVEALNGFHHGSRFMNVVYHLANEIRVLAGVQEAAPFGDVLGRGGAYARFRSMVTAQGGDVTYLDSFEPAKNGGFTLRDLARDRKTDGILHRLKPEGLLHPCYIVADKPGYVYALELTKIGETIRALGAGRYKKGETVNPDVGVIFTAGLGDYVQQGEVLALVLHDAQKGNPGEIERYLSVGPEKQTIQPLVKERIEAR